MTYRIFKKIWIVAFCLAAELPSKQVMAQAPGGVVPGGERTHETKSLSLNEAIKLSLQNSKQLKLSQAKIDEATANYKDARNNRLPDLKISGAYLRVNNPNVDLKVNLSGSSGSDSGKSSKPISVNQALYGLATASLPLFSGLRIKYGVESAKYLEQAAKLDADNDKEDVILNTTNAFSNLYKAKNTVDLVQENLQQEEQRVNDFKNLVNNGVMARNDLLKAELQESNIELTLLDAQNNFRMSCVNMDLMLGLPEGTDLNPDTSLFVNKGDAGTVDNWEQTAMQNRKDISALSFRERAAASAIKSAKGEYYPGIALTAGYVGLDVPNLLTIDNALNVGVGLQYNLGALWKTGAKVQQAKARLHELEANESLLSDQVRIQINEGYENYLLCLKKINVYNVAIEQANENYRITKNKFDNKLETTTNLLEADVAQLQAELNLAFAKVDAAVAYNKLQQAAGVISK